MCLHVGGHYSQYWLGSELAGKQVMPLCHLLISRRVKATRHTKPCLSDPHNTYFQIHPTRLSVFATAASTQQAHTPARHTASKWYHYQASINLTAGTMLAELETNLITLILCPTPDNLVILSKPDNALNPNNSRSLKPC